MGSWIGTGVAKYHPERLLSLTLGGWDPISGLETQNRALGVPLTIEAIVAGARSAAPELTHWITPQVEPALQACWDALTEIAGSREALVNCNAPVLFWDGVDDPYHAPAQALARELSNASFLSAKGDHLTAITAHAMESVRGFRDFLGRTRQNRE
jgi:pimeloyl-ACP methyl ester carboxylesterase